MPTTGDINNSLNTAIADSLNEVNEDNSVNEDYTVGDSFNETTDVVITDETTTDVEGSFNEGSNNESTVITDSGNDNSDNSINDSGNSLDFDFADGSYNTDNSETDNSVNAGVREYNTGFGGVSGSSAAAAGGAGHTEIWSQSTIVDQSVNQNIAAEGAVTQDFANFSVTASGADSIAAGGDFTSVTTIDESTNFTAEGDINIGNETSVTTVTDSFNTVDVDFSYTDESTVIDVTDSFNDFSENYAVDGSFNTEDIFESTTDISVDYTEVVDSFNSVDATFPIL
ncbi:hypothetical protein ACFWZW_14385 [Microbacterium enclense]|uniref:hypothetical protein n=1 Tax=Microbacterium enclense TaxID=993073 RepID=UPI001F9553EC|nr:hypothetical protein [Actinomycetota bacterium]